MELNTIHNLHCYEAENILSDNSIDCIVTSPPYWNLRNYGVAGQFGLEETVEEYVNNLVKLFDILHCKLKDTGTCFVNLGDSYNGSCGLVTVGVLEKTNRQKAFKEKSLLLIPYLFAYQMISRDWVLRNIIIWHKKNSFPQSVKDRFTVDFEPIFFFTKNKNYYFKQQLEPFITKPRIRNFANTKIAETGVIKPICKNLFKNEGKNMRTVWTLTNENMLERHFASYPKKLVARILKSGCREGGVVLDPFIGSGTTAVVAKQLNMNYIGFELNPEYIAICNKRLNNEVGMF